MESAAASYRRAHGLACEACVISRPAVTVTSCVEAQTSQPAVVVEPAVTIASGVEVQTGQPAIVEPVLHPAVNVAPAAADHEDALVVALARIKSLEADNSKLRFTNHSLKRKLVAVRSAQHEKSRKLRKCSKQKVKDDEKIVELNRTADASDLKRGRCRRYFSLRGGFTIAAKRCMANTASYALGLVMGMDVDPRTVRRWELRLRAAQIHSFRCWVRRKYEALFNPFCKGGLRIVFNRIRGDATNALVWRKTKLHVLELMLVFVHIAVTDDTPWNMIQEAIDDDCNRKIICDIHVVQATGTGYGMLGMIEAHLDSVGCPRFVDHPERYQPEDQQWHYALFDEVGVDSRPALLDSGALGEVPVEQPEPPDVPGLCLSFFIYLFLFISISVIFVFPFCFY